MSLVQVKRNWNPVEIKILLDCYYQSGPIFIHTPAEGEAIQQLVNLNLIISVGDSVMKITDKGIAFVNLILSLELPIEVWVDSHGTIIHEKKEL